MGLRTASITPASGGFGLWQISEWQPEGENVSVEDLATEGECTISHSPGDRYAGLIQGESDADGWLIPDDRCARPFAYRLD